MNTKRVISQATQTQVGVNALRCECDSSVLPKTISFVGTTNTGVDTTRVENIIIGDACGIFKTLYQSFYDKALKPNLKNGVTQDSFLELIQTFKADVDFITLDSATDDGFSTTNIEALKLGINGNSTNTSIDPAGSVRNTQEQLGIQTIKFAPGELVLTTDTALRMITTALSDNLKFIITIQVRQWMPYN